MNENLMDCVVFKEVGKYEITQRPIPRIQRANDVLVKVLACSICGTDVHILSDPPIYTATPGTIIGHEIVGEVVECGEAVQGLQKGNRLIMDNNIACETCEVCRKGDYNVCPNMKSIGMEYDGAFAQYLVCPDSNLIKIHQDAPVGRAIFAEPLNVAMGGLKKIRIMPGDNIVIVGDGPIGMYFCKLCKAMGAGKVIVAGLSEYRRPYITQSGADRFVIVTEEDLQTAIREEMPLGADIAIECVGTTINDCIDAVRPGGKVLVVGLNELATQEICQHKISRRGIDVLGTFIGVHTMQEVANGLNSGLLDFSYLVTHRLPLKDFAIGLEAMRRSEALEVILYPWGEIN